MSGEECVRIRVELWKGYGVSYSPETPADVVGFYSWRDNLGIVAFAELLQQQLDMQFYYCQGDFTLKRVVKETYVVTNEVVLWEPIDA